jgi:hypothetical protein
LREGRPCTADTPQFHDWQNAIEGYALNVGQVSRKSGAKTESVDSDRMGSTDLRRIAVARSRSELEVDDDSSERISSAKLSLHAPQI